MYINDIHILYYYGIAIIGLLVGQYTDYLIKRTALHEKIISFSFFREYLHNCKINCYLMYITAIIYLVLLYKLGFSIDLIEYLILTPLLLSVFIIDFKEQIIPNRINLSIFEIGLIFALGSGVLLDFNIMINKLLGLVIGGGVFWLITLIGGLIAGKEAMGYGDVKLMGALGLIFGIKDIIIISVISFLLAAIVGVALLIIRRKKVNEYIPFGPFIIIATFIIMFIPENLALFLLLKFFSLGTYKES